MAQVGPFEQAARDAQKNAQNPATAQAFKDLAKLESEKFISKEDAATIRTVLQHSNNVFQINLDKVEERSKQIFSTPAAQSAEVKEAGIKKFSESIAPIAALVNVGDLNGAAQKLAPAFDKAAAFICTRQPNGEVHPIAPEGTAEEQKGFGSINQPKKPGSLTGAELINNIEAVKNPDIRIAEYQKALDQAENNRREVFQKRAKDRIAAGDKPAIDVPANSKSVANEIAATRSAAEYREKAEELLSGPLAKVPSAKKDEALKLLRTAAETHPFFYKP